MTTDEEHALIVDILDGLEVIDTLKDCEETPEIEDNSVPVGEVLAVAFIDRDGGTDSVADDENEEDLESLGELERVDTTV